MKEKMITLGSIIAPAQGFISSEIDDETVMMSIEKGMYYGMDPIGSEIWQQIQKPITVSTLIENLLREYDVERSTCETDMLNFLNQLLSEDVITIVEPPG